MALGTRDLHAFLRGRRTVRRFRADPVPPEALARLLETATYAPSAHNRQPWRFVVITNPAIQQRLAEAMGAEFQSDLKAEGYSNQEIEARVGRSIRRITAAPVAIVLCADLAAGGSEDLKRRAEAEALMLVQDTALAGGALLLAARAEGLGGVWMCAPLFIPETVCQILSLPETWEPQALILLGYPNEMPEARPRRTVAEVTRYL